MQMQWKRSWQWLLICLISLTWVFSGCGCEPDIPPPPPRPEIKIEPSNWLLSDKLPQGIKAYKKFTITNKATVELGQDPDPLEIKSIKLEDTTGQFKILMNKDDCPYPPDPQCKDQCVTYSDNQPICFTLPVSLPVKLKFNSDEKLTFVVEYTPNSTGQSPKAKIIIESNTKNEKDEEFIKTDLVLEARGGEPVIEVSGKNLQPSGQKEFNFSAGKTDKGKTVTETFQVANTGDADLTVTLSWEKEDKQFKITAEDGSEIIGNKFTLAPAAQAPKNAKTFKITYSPDDCGSHEARLKIASNAVFKTLDKDKGIVSSPTLYLRVTGSSPTGAEVSPGTLNFGDVKLNTSKTEKFTIQVGPLGLCDVIVYGITLAAQDGGGGEPKFFSFGEMLKNGSKVSPPTKSTPVVLKKGDKLEVAVVFAPTSKIVSDGVIKIDTNDPDLDPENKGVVNLRAGTERNDPPVASFVFRCGEDNSAACKKGEDLAGSVFLSNEQKIRVELDSSKSSDKENKIVKYEWKKIKFPDTSIAEISTSCTDKATCVFVVDGPGFYKVQLTIWDDLNQKSTVTNELRVNP